MPAILSASSLVILIIGNLQRFPGFSDRLKPFKFSLGFEVVIFLKYFVQASEENFDIFLLPFLFYFYLLFFLLDWIGLDLVDFLYFRLSTCLFAGKLEKMKKKFSILAILYYYFKISLIICFFIIYYLII